MHNLCIPVTVSSLVRKVIHAVSTLSIAHQYHNFHGNTKTDHVPAILEREPSSPDSETKPLSTSTLAHWPGLSYTGSWWPRTNPVEQYYQFTQTIGISIPWINGQRKPSSSNPILDSSKCAEKNEQQHRPPEYNNHNQPEPKRDPGGQQQTELPLSEDMIHKLMHNPALYDPIRKPRFPIVLCHGLYGFDVRGPSSVPLLQQHYWTNILNILRKKVGAEVIVTAVPSTGSIASRSAKLHTILQERAQGRGINFLAHSMGGLDCRHLISHIKPTEYTPLSLTTVGTPHRGSPFMDWCQDNIGLGKMDVKATLNKTRSEIPTLSSEPSSESSAGSSSPFLRAAKPLLSLSSLPSSFTTLLLSLLDSPAYANLTTKYLNEVFNPATPDYPGVKYFSVAGRVDGVSIWHPLWLPKMVLDGVERKMHPLSSEDRGWGNDGLVSVESAKWGEFLGTLEGCDHWEMRGARGLDLNVDFSSVTMPSFARSIGKKGEQDGDPWSLKDWGKFVKLWRSEEDKANVSASMLLSHSHVPTEDGDRDRENALKASTDKVSAVLDWIVDQVPSTSKQDASTTLSRKEQMKKRDLATKEGLERLYVALSKKLYDEGL